MKASLGIPISRRFRLALAKGLLVGLIMLSSAGCAKVYYVGDEFGPTEDVDFFYSKESINKPYEEIGHVLGSGFLVRNR